MSHIQIVKYKILIFLPFLEFFSKIRSYLAIIQLNLGTGFKLVSSHYLGILVRIFFSNFSSCYKLIYLPIVISSNLVTSKCPLTPVTVRHCSIYMRTSPVCLYALLGTPTSCLFAGFFPVREIDACAFFNLFPS